MTTQENNANIYDSLAVGEQLAHLEYIVTPELLEEYREVVGYTEAYYHYKQHSLYCIELLLSTFFDN